MLKISFTNAEVSDHGYGLEVNDKSLEDIISTELKQVDFQVVIQLLRSTSRTFLAMRKASVRSLEPEMVISL